jgi:hypothetical protein
MKQSSILSFVPTLILDDEGPGAFVAGRASVVAEGAGLAVKSGIRAGYDATAPTASTVTVSPAVQSIAFTIQARPG